MTHRSEDTLVALLSGPDGPGIVAATSGWIAERDGLILHADQHSDLEAGIFFQRLEWVSSAPEPAREADDFAAFARTLGMAARVTSAAVRPRVAVLVSRIDHCFQDLLYRWRTGELHADLTGVISNHPDLREDTERHRLPFHHVPVTANTRDDAEARTLALLDEWKTDLAVMARYMQILSPAFLERFARPVINIHHSFLPAFSGARPYHQAHTRGVKLIGATAHYATAILDDGPIIAQDVAPVTHRDSVPDLIRKGRDLERTVFARAVRLHCEHRVLAYHNKTVVFE
ncbi:MAG: formyltetrahydrofolate deformylase [Deltaproteobacteria bacterium]|nr:MAG: formyltetrahydrofolate deformylase [Deltaproteobacteria bacterium]